MPNPKTDDRQQQRALGRNERKRTQRFEGALRAVLNTPEGRLVFGELEIGLIARCGVFRSIWESSARIHYNAGRQDFGHELVDLLIATDERAYLAMEHECRDLARRDRSEVSAALTPSATEGETDHG